MKTPISTSLVICILFLLVSVLPLNADSLQNWDDKVDPWVLKTSRAGQTEFLVFLSEQADLSRAAELESKLEKGTFVYEELSALAEATQDPVLDHLKSLNVEYRSYWITNMIWVRGDLDTVRLMAERTDVFHIYANPRVKIDAPLTTYEDPDAHSTEAVEWNIALVNADDVWALGVNGTGTVAAGQDTGYMWNHPALINQYRGGAGNHDYNWHDSVHSGGGTCGADSPEPCDDHGHGTHTMGTVVGDDGVGNQIGMAPGAQWIGCRNMNVGVGTPTTYAECYQFFLAPTDLNDANADPAMAPDVINNSWGCPVSEGCTDPNVLLTVVQNIRAAGIVTVHSAGNDGSGCSTIAEPAAIYDESYSVGATDSSDSIASFSSRGPVTTDGSNRLKPDISAPGSNIRSCVRGGGYEGGWSGTSMAGPHVAGLVALLIDQNPALAGNVDLVEEMINQTALGLTTSQGCGGDTSTDIPNNVFGWGRIDALAAANYSADFLVNASPLNQNLCIPDTAYFTIDLLQFQGFTDPVTLEAINLPVGVSDSFSANPVTPPGMSTLSLIASPFAEAGGSAITVTGTSFPSGIAHEASINLNLYKNAPAGPSLSSPANTAEGVSIQPDFSWIAGPHARSFTIEIATDSGFTNIVFILSGINQTSYSLANALDPGAMHYWRVTAENECGSEISNVFSFTTVILVCGLYTSADVPQAINDIGTTTSILTIAAQDGGRIADVNVVNLVGAHTYMGDLDFNVLSPAGTSVMVMDRRCGSDENFNLNLDDEAASIWPCPPTDGGTYLPFVSLSGFNGEDSTGDWSLIINDNAGNDSGNLNGWGLEICVEEVPIFTDGFESGDTNNWSQ